MAGTACVLEGSFTRVPNHYLLTNTKDYTSVKLMFCLYIIYLRDTFMYGQ